MKCKMMMWGMFLALVILTIGAISAAEDIDFNETITADDVSVDTLQDDESESLKSSGSDTLKEDSYGTVVMVDQDMAIDGDDSAAWITLEPELKDSKGSFVILDENNVIFNRPLTAPTGNAGNWHNSGGDLKCIAYLRDINLTQVNDGDDIKFTFIDGNGDEVKKYTQYARVYRNATTIKLFIPVFPMEFSIDCETEFPINNLQAIFANVTVPRDMQGRFVLKSNGTILLERNTWEYNESYIHIYDYGLPIGYEDNYLFGNLSEGDVVTFEFFNDNGEKVLGYFFSVHFKNNTVRFEDIGYDDSLYFSFILQDGINDGWTQYGLLVAGMSLEPKLISSGGKFVIIDEDFVMYSSPTSQFAADTARHWHVGDGFFKCHAYTYDININNVASGDLIKFAFINSQGVEIEKYTQYRIISISGSEIHFFNQVDPNLNVYANNISKGDNVIINVTAHPKYSGNVTIQFGNSSYVVAVTNGYGNLSVSGLEVGTYFVVATSSGSSAFDVSVKNCTFSVKDKTVINSMASSVTTTYGVSKNIVVTLKDSNGKVLNGKNITAVLNGVKTTLKTDSKGQVSLPVGTKLSAGKYAALFTFNGDSDYAKSSSSVKVVVNKAKTKLTAKNKVLKLKGSKKYTVVLKTDKNKAISKVKVTIKVKGKKYTAVTNSKGKATFNLKKLTKKGKYSAKVTFNGSKNFKDITKSVKITVKK